ncbi:MMPL family transporter [Streptomyces sp. NBC_00233]|uniref:MMPL family transporter n=1 Tax=Streptomyces sp. NBC_00233 TaxID=2975686 RepID=UPI002254A3B8|nr:MMPL family transporter [Streptomyces sp. NBC_00233]MCX5229814.1 MMPL family transporter [Streptomyces sp. NBC_00233]
MDVGTWARWCFRHKWVVIGLWVVVLVGTIGASSSLGDKYANVFDLPGTDSSKAISLMQKAFPEQAGETDTVVWRVDEGSVRDDEVRTKMTAALEKVAAQPDVGSVASPYGEAGAGQISEDGRTAYASVTFTKQGNELEIEQMKALIETARAPAGDGLAVEVGGATVALAEAPPAHLSEIVGVLAAAVVLFLAFGSLFGMLLPIITTLFAVGTASATIALLSRVTTVPEVSTWLAMLVGLGVGIDYALFIVTRHRKGILAGKAPEDAAVTAVNTSGRAVIFAGGTVCIALLGMFALRMSFLNGVTISAALTVVITVIASITVLPAMLGVLGMRVLSRRQRRRLAAAGPQAENKARLTARWSLYVEKHPRVLAVAAFAAMLVIAVPALSLRLGTSDQGNNPETSTTRQAYDLLAEGFGPGFNGPLQVVAEVPGPQDRSALDGLVERLRSTEGVAQVVPVPTGETSKVAIVQVVPTTNPQSEETSELIDRIREDVVPAAEQGSALRAYVGGGTALGEDFADTLAGKLPGFIGAIVALGFLLLLIAFRSIVVPLTAAVMNLIAAAASFGVVVAIFQWGWGGEFLAAGRPGPIEAFLPVIMLSLLFGLSMDYQVFLVSRMHEEWVHTRDNARAVRVGLAESSRVINAAGVIMICVFSAFMLSGQRATAMFGLGLAGAVALDAFILRTVLVPALMHLFGASNWWLPGWLEKRLPHFAVEPPEETETGHDGLVVHGFVHTADGSPVEGAAITLLASDGSQTDRVLSHVDGGYVLTAPEQGLYVVSVEARDHTPHTVDVSVGAVAVQRDLRLAPADTRAH